MISNSKDSGNLLGNTHIGKELCEVLCIKDNGIAWSFGSWNVFYQYVLADEVLYVTYGCVFGTLLAYDILFPEVLIPQKHPNGSLSNYLFRVYT